MKTKLNRNDANSLIAEFMGYVYFPYTDSEKGMVHGWCLPQMKRSAFQMSPPGVGQSWLSRTTKDLRYDTSMDWMMLVLRKISTLQNVSIMMTPSMCSITYYNHRSPQINFSASGEGVVPFHTAAVSFIEWFKLNKETENL